MIAARKFLALIGAIIALGAAAAHAADCSSPR